jgi:hypothetical protein
MDNMKPYIRQVQRAEGVLILDDSIAENPHTDENDISGDWIFSFGAPNYTSSLYA